MPVARSRNGVALVTAAWTSSGSPPAGGVCPHATPLYVIHIRVCGVRFRFLDFLFHQDGGTRPLVMATLAEMPEAEYMCLPQSFCDYTKTLPTRACTRESLPELNSRIRNRVSSFSNLFYFIFFF